VFGFEKGMNVAAAITSFNSETELELDPSYGKLMFKSVSWGADGTTGDVETEIEPHVCSNEELNSDGKSENPTFYKTHESSAGYAKMY